MTCEPALSRNGQGGSTIGAVDDRAEVVAGAGDGAVGGRAVGDERQRVLAADPLVDGDRADRVGAAPVGEDEDVAERVVAGEVRRWRRGSRCSGRTRSRSRRRRCCRSGRCRSRRACGRPPGWCRPPRRRAARSSLSGTTSFVVRVLPVGDVALVLRAAAGVEAVLGAAHRVGLEGRVESRGRRRRAEPGLGLVDVLPVVAGRSPGRRRSRCRRAAARTYRARTGRRRGRPARCRWRSVVLTMRSRSRGPPTVVGRDAWVGSLDSTRCGPPLKVLVHVPMPPGLVGPMRIPRAVPRHPSGP